MRGRKHPLEVFRQNGRTFQTLRDEAAKSEEPVEPVEIIPRRRSLRPRPPRPERSDEPEPQPRREVPESRQRPQDVAEPPGEGATERAAASKARRAWDARPKIQRAGPGLRGARALKLPLPRVMGVLAGLVLVVGAAYALRLWPFAPEGSMGQDPTRLQSTLRWLWPDRSVEPRDQGETPAPEEGPEPSPTEAATRPEPTPDRSEKAGEKIEYWVLVASVKLTAADRRSGSRNELFKPDQEKIAKTLGTTFPWMRVQLCYGDAKQEDVLLRAGPASAADDAQLLKLRDRIRALDPRFKDAYIKPYRTKS